MKTIKSFFFSLSFILLGLAGCMNEEIDVAKTDAECDTVKDIECSLDCSNHSISCATLDALFGAGSTPGNLGHLDSILNCLLGHVAVESCELYCPVIKVRSGVNGVPWVWEALCESQYDDIPLCQHYINGYNISGSNQQNIIDDAIDLANNNIPSGCDYVVVSYDLFWVRVSPSSTPGCTNSSVKVDWRIGVEVTYGPTLCAG